MSAFRPIPRQFPHMLLRRTFVCAAAMALQVAGTGSALAQSIYPSRPIQMIEPQTAGGTNDIVGRLGSQKLAEVLADLVAIENKPGAGGNIGTQLVVKAPKDGHTLLMTISSSQAINPALHNSADFAQTIKADYGIYEKIIRDANIKFTEPDRSFHARSLCTDPRTV